MSIKIRYILVLPWTICDTDFIVSIECLASIEWCVCKSYMEQKLNIISFI